MNECLGVGSALYESMSGSSVGSALYEETLAVASKVARAALGLPDLLLADPPAEGEGVLESPAHGHPKAVRRRHGTQLAFALEEESRQTGMSDRQGDTHVRQTGMSDRQGMSDGQGHKQANGQTVMSFRQTAMSYRQGDRHRETDMSDGQGHKQTLGQTGKH